MFAGNFAPRGWAFCDGQLLAVSQNDALFSLLGTIYGGDGQTTFGLPDMRGRIPVHPGSGPGLSPRTLGARGGAETVTLTVNQLPSHGHAPFRASTDRGNETGAAGNLLAESPNVSLYVEDPAFDNLAPESVASVGGSRSHDNLMPYLCVHFIIALVGIYPSQN